jgi:hypothetical protein
MSEGVSDLNTFLAFAEHELQAGALFESSEFRKISTWSSLSALLFISAIHERHDVLISSADLAVCVTLGDIHRLILNRSNGKSNG